MARVKRYMHVVVEVGGDSIAELDEDVARLAAALEPWPYRHSILTDEPRPVNPIFAYYAQQQTPGTGADEGAQHG